MLKIENCSITFNAGTLNERKALREINLVLNEGDFATVIGSNGAGKSTLLNCIAGTYECNNGKITLANQDITYLAEHKRANFIGRLFQNPLLGTAPNMTIEENLGLAYCRGRKYGLFSTGIKKRDRDFYKTTLERLNLGLEDRLKANVGLLSGGQRQALTLLMSTIVTPKLLLLDEHTAALDPNTSEQVMKITDEIIHQNNITTLMITHNISNALAYGNKTIVMNEGQIVFILEGEERKNMTVEKLIQLYTSKTANEFSDRMIL